MRSAGRSRWQRALACIVTTALVFGCQLPFNFAAGQTGNVAIRGKVFDMNSGDPLPGAIVHAVHLDTKDVYSSEPSSSSGAYVLDRLPFGYYDLAVESEGGLFLSNRVIRAPAGEKITISMILGEPQAADTEWWSADPHRRIPGLDRAPDGVSRIVEGAPRRVPGALGDAPRPAVAKATGTVGADGRRGWLIPALVAGGLMGLALVIEDDDDKAQDQGASPF